MVKDCFFGRVRARIYTIEYQKRGLPHVHSLWWLHEEDKIRPEEYDDFVCAEIPDQETEPELFNLVTKNMIHGPCGEHNPSAPCMQDGKCTKGFPKSFLQDTVRSQNGYPLYRRRTPEDGGKTANIYVRGQRKYVTVDNRWVVPYNKQLLLYLKGHTNVELCSSVEAIKYVIKYIAKGHDMAVFSLEQDEIKQYQTARYLGPVEACWRIFAFKMHDRYPFVERLAVHLENQQQVYFNLENIEQRAATPAPRTSLTSFFDLCRNGDDDEVAKGLLYCEMPGKFSKPWLFVLAVRGLHTGRVRRGLL